MSSVCQKLTPSMSCLLGDLKKKITPIEQFYDKALNVCDLNRHGDVIINATKVWISVEDARVLFHSLRDYLETLFIGKNSMELAVEYWLMVGPQISQEVQKGFVKLEMGYLWIETKPQSNTIH